MKKWIVLLVSVLLALAFVGCGETAAPYIQDGYWYIDGTNTGIKAEGVDGADGTDGADGVDGADGLDGLTPYIQEGYWYIGEIDTGIRAEGADGLNGLDGRSVVEVQVEDGCFWVTYSNDPEHPVNVGRADENTNYLSLLLDSVFTVKKGEFVCESETLGNPSWQYTGSTFSGWGGSIGAPTKLEAVAIRVRAREQAITKIRFHLNENDKNGRSIACETLTVNIQPGEEAEIVWELPKKISVNKKQLYFSFNCNSLCDVYSNMNASANIPADKHQAVMTYTTDGRLLESASQMTDVSGKECRYLYAKLGYVKDVLVLKDEFYTEQNGVNVFLADEYALAVNDNFQLFYRGVVQAVDPYHYDVSIKCAKGKAYPRYFEWTPTEEDVGAHTLTLSVFDNNGKLLGTDTTVLNVYAPVATHPVQNVLCIGDSLTASGYWVAEAQRRFTAQGGTPEGLGLDYLNFIGTVEKTINGQTVAFEGYGGWTWERYCSEASPFYDEALGDISFRSYCEKNGFDTIDVVYVLLTWNGQGTAFKTDFPLDEGHFACAQRLLDKLHEEYPDAVVRCMGVQMPSQNGGMGASYGAGGGYSADYGMLVTALHYNAALEALCKLEKYNDFVKYVDIAGQFDTEYNMPAMEKPMNNRNDVTETVGSNGVHPSVSGYYQIADAVFRSFCQVFSGKMEG